MTSSVNKTSDEAKEPLLIAEPEYQHFLDYRFPLDPKTDNIPLTKTANWLATKIPEETETEEKALNEFKDDPNMPLTDELKMALHRRVMRQLLMPNLQLAIRCFNHNFPYEKDVADDNERRTRSQLRQIIMDAISQKGNFEAIEIVLRYFRSWCRLNFEDITNPNSIAIRYDKMRKLGIDVDLELWKRRFPYINRELIESEDKAAWELYKKSRELDSLIKAIYYLIPYSQTFLIYTTYEDPKIRKREASRRRWLQSETAQRIQKIFQEREQAKKGKQSTGDPVLDHIAGGLLGCLFDPRIVFAKVEPTLEQKLNQDPDGYDYTELAQRLDPYRVKTLKLEA